MSLSRKTPGPRLSCEPLEDRLALSWAAVPPASISLPAAAALTLSASLSASGQTTISTSEIDYYTFVAPRGGAYRIAALTPNSNLDTILGVYNTAGARIAHNDDMNASTFDSEATVYLTAGQRIFFGITNHVGDPGGSYSWSVVGPQVVTAAADDRYENNDTLAAASSLGTLTARTTLTGLMLADGADWYRFTMTGPGTTSHAVSLAFTHARGNLGLRLYSASGTLLRSANGVANGERVSLAGLSAGTYYVQVSGARNPAYTLDIQPAAAPAASSPAGNRVLYLNFDGYAIGRSELTRWAGSDWGPTVDLLDPDRNGIRVSPLLAGRADREQIISRMLQLLQEDLSPFGISVRRITGGAVEGVGATTVFLGPATLAAGYKHVAAAIDAGNTDRTDVAFVGNEDWGTVERTALALADVTLHEAGHTWGLVHVDSGSVGETMGLRYSVDDSAGWVRNTAFLDQTFAVLPDGPSIGSATQNSYQTMRRLFGGPTVVAGGVAPGGVASNVAAPGFVPDSLRPFFAALSISLPEPDETPHALGTGRFAHALRGLRLRP